MGAAWRRGYGALSRGVLPFFLRAIPRLIKSFSPYSFLNQNILFLIGTLDKIKKES
jgi:hypothetical protein